MQSWKEMVKRLLPSWDGRLGIDHVSYNWNGAVHRDIPYVTNSAGGVNATNMPAVIAQKVALYKAAGFDMIRITWQGPWSTAAQQDTLLMAAECAKQGMQFALLLDPGGMQKWKGIDQGAAVITANVEAALTDAKTVAQILDSPAYVPEKLIFDFNTGATLGTLAQKFPNLKFLAQNLNFGWPDIPTKPLEQFARNAASLAVQKAQNALATMSDPCLCAHFNDAGQPQPVNVQSMAAFIAAGGNRDFNESVWSLLGIAGKPSVPARILASFGGLFLQQQLAITPASAPRIWVATADDYDEGTAIEPQLNEQAGIVWAS